MTDQAANGPRPEWDLQHELAALRSEISPQYDRLGRGSDDLRKMEYQREILDRRTGGRWYGLHGWLRRIKKCLASMNPHTRGRSNTVYYIYIAKTYSEVRIFNDLRLFGCELSRFRLHNKIAVTYPHLERALALGVISYVDVEKTKGDLQDPLQAPGAIIMITE